MFTNTNDYMTGRKPIPTGCEIDLLAVRFPIAALAADLTLGNIAQIGALPAGHIPVGVIVDSDDLDTNPTPTVVLEVGLIDPATGNLSTLAADGGGSFGTTTIAQGGGQAQIYSKAIARVQPDPTKSRTLAIKVNAAAATAAAGEIGVTLLYRAA